MKNIYLTQLFDVFSERKQSKIFGLYLTILCLATGDLLYSQTTVTLTPSDTSPWTVPAGVTSINIEAWGAGGAGGGSTIDLNGGSGGGGGGYTTLNAVPVSPGQNIVFSVGTGGTGNAGTGATGGPTSILTLSANGGEGGTNDMGPFGAGGTAAGGTNTSGGDGIVGTATGNAGGAGANGGTGGAGNVSDADGYPGTFPGGGGGGGEYLTVSSNGGNGGNGQITIFYKVPTITNFTPSNGCTSTPTTVTITGTNFLGATSVSVNAMAASMTIDSDTQITAVIPAGASTGAIKVIIPSGFGTSAASFTVNPLPTVAAITGTTSVCVGSSTTLSSSPAGGVWSSATTTVASVNAGSGVVTGLAAGTSVISYTVTDGNGCTNKSTTTITVNPTPTVAPITGTTSVCVGSTTTLSNATAPGVWTSATTTKATINSSGVVTGVAVGTSVISYKVTDGNGCSTTVTTTVTVNSLPVVNNITGTPRICYPGTTTNLNDTTPGGVWSSATTSVATVNAGGVVTKVSAGTTIISYTVTANGCSTAKTVLVTVYETLSPLVISAPQTVCINNTPAPITAISPSPLPGGNGLYTYQWQRKDDNTPTWSNINGSGGTGGPTYSPSTVNPGNGSTWYQLIITSGPCGSVTSNTIYIENVTDTGFKYTVTNGPSTAVCPGSSFTLLASSTHASPSAVRFTWTANSAYISPASGGPSGTTGPISADGNYRTSTLDIPLTVQNNGNTSVTTTVTVTAIAYNYPGGVLGTVLCAASKKTVSVTIRPVPVATATVPSGAICTSSSADIIVRSNITDATTTFNWVRDNILGSGGNVGGTASGTSGAIAAGAPYTLVNTLTNASDTSQTVNYTITPVSNGCSGAPITVTITFPSTTWNGSSWSNGNPMTPPLSLTKQAIINGNLTIDSDFSACSLIVLSGTVVVNSGVTVTIQNGVIVTGGSLTFENNASLVQVNPTGNSGNITYKRDTTPVSKFDYTYWSTPVNPQTLFNLSPTTLSDKYFWWNNAIYNWSSIPGSTQMSIGRGYIIRGPNGNLAPAIFTGSFVGIPNNGDYTVPITVSGANNMNLIGNPYPSAISANLFISNPANSIAFGTGTTLYFWTHNTPITNNIYTDNDYASYNYTGGTGSGTASANSGVNNSVPNGNIAAGQGFFIKGIASGTATFKNSMRLTGSNTQFFRMNNYTDTKEDPAKNRLWLELKNNQGANKQILVGYVEHATNNYDSGFDGEILEFANSASFYSLLDAAKLSIQGRALPFEVNDHVALGYQAITPDRYSIGVNHLDGLFKTQNVYLEDKLLNTIHNIKQSPYTFISAAGIFNDRFVLRYTNTSLGIANAQAGVIALIINKKIIAQASENIKNIQVFDITGKLIKTFSPKELDKYFEDDFMFAGGIYIVKVKLENNTIFTQKLVN